MGILQPKNDTLITMARLVFEDSGLDSIINASFCIGDDQTILMYNHDDEKGTKELYETCTVAELVASYIGLNLAFDIDANDAVTTGHRLGRTGR